MIPETAGDRLKRWALAEFGSLSALARALGFRNVSTIFQYTSGRRRIGVSVQSKLRDLNAPVTYIVTGVDEAGWLKRAGTMRVRPNTVVITTNRELTDEERKAYEDVGKLVAEFDPEDTDELKEIIRALLKHKGR